MTVVIKNILKTLIFTHVHKFIYIYTLYIYICTHLKVRHSVKELLISSINKVTTDFVGSFLEHKMTIE